MDHYKPQELQQPPENTCEKLFLEEQSSHDYTLELLE